jgi:YD repeat-containing protein
VATSTDRKGNATSFVYDSYNLYPATTTNALLQKTQSYFNLSNGKVRQSTDPNSRLAKNIFDGLGRLTETDQSSTTTPSSYDTAVTFAYTDSTSTPSLVHRTDYLTSANVVDTFDYYDGFNRLIQERKQSPTAGTFTVFDKKYNGVGLLASSSLPYFSSGSSNTSPTNTANFYTNYLYDPLQRPVTISNVSGTTTNAYSKWTTTTTDPNNHIKDYILDAFGNLATVVEHLDTSNSTTTYVFDPLNNLATTTDGLGNVRAFSYDGLSRRLTSQDLHGSSDTTYGTSSYAYDDQSNLITEVTPNGKTITRTYDALNRKLTESVSGLSGNQIAFTYDSCTNGIGYMCIASSTAAKTTNSYDILGNVTSATTTVSNLSYHMGYGFDRQGNITNLTYPDSSQVLVLYNLAGLPNKIQRKPSGGSYSDVISNYDYAPQGKIQNALFGNNASSTYFYDSNAMYRLSNLQTTGASNTSIQRYAYTYDPAGNITQINNTASTSANANISYIYDALNRLISASTNSASSSPYTQSFTYDALGNMLTNTFTTGTSTGGVSGSPTILDTLNLALRHLPAVTSDSFSYTVPTGSNKLLVVWLTDNDGTHAPTATLNGVSTATFTKVSGTADRAAYWYSYLAAPTTGTFQINFSASTDGDYEVFTLQNASQSSPVDTSNVTNNVSASTKTTSITTTVSYDFMVSYGLSSAPNTKTSFGAGETQIIASDQDDGSVVPTGIGPVNSAWKAGAAAAGTESMTTT